MPCKDYVCLADLPVFEWQPGTGAPDDPEHRPLCAEVTANLATVQHGKLRLRDSALAALKPVFAIDGQAQSLSGGVHFVCTSLYR